VNRQEKETIVGELRDTFGRASVALVATNLGLSVEESTQLRRDIRAVGGEMRVAKHSLAKLALTDTPYADITRFLVGPQGLVFGFDDPVGVAKVLVDFVGGHPKVEIEGGAFEGQVLESGGVENLAKMPDLGTLRALLVCQVQSPASRIASQVVAPTTRIAGAVAARIEQLEESSAA